MLRLLLEYLFLTLYGLTLLASILRYRRYFDTRLRYLPIIFCYTLLNEILGYLTAYFPQFGFFSNEAIAWYNLVIYNIYNIIFFLYFFLIYRHYLESQKAKRFILWAVYLFSIVAVLNPFFQSFLISSQTGTYIVGGLVLIFCTSSYLISWYKLEERHPNKNKLLYWISLGMLIFYIGYLPIKTARFIFSITGSQEAPTIRIFHYCLIIIMYSLIIVGFARLKKRLIR
ncbi:hypothetical protein D1013_16395 [Euzebyella marina]|uniref:Histidine kinase N-terminal 7TM region domain-containing protein n=1 Tax=Euzebyella marina TaxID=1761453 RepID=A0A3G2L9B7_9FLAO|nr:hypothetical protein [Euzebyella marina]AYN68847.1 hypothetical protein D1013_16395 [Euzebyella marina]